MHIIDDAEYSSELMTPADAPFLVRQQYMRNLGSDLQRGDIVGYKDHLGYRNSGKAIFDGVDIVNLRYEEDDYGSVPNTFFVGDEFMPDHWLRTVETDIYQGDLIEHNSYVWIDTRRHGTEMLSNLVHYPDEYQTYFNGTLGRFYITIPEHLIDRTKSIIHQRDPLLVEADSGILTVPY